MAKAQSLATALRTIGKFTISKRAGEGGKIFGRYVLPTALTQPSAASSCKLAAPCGKARSCTRQASKLAVACCSVSAQEVVDAIYGQTGQKLDKEALQLPEMKTVGTHQAAIQLHPDVIGRFSVVISKAKQK